MHLKALLTAATLLTLSNALLVNVYGPGASYCDQGDRISLVPMDLGGRCVPIQQGGRPAPARWVQWAGTNGNNDIPYADQSVRGNFVLDLYNDVGDDGQCGGGKKTVWLGSGWCSDLGSLPGDDWVKEFKGMILREV